MKLDVLCTSIGKQLIRLEKSSSLHKRDGIWAQKQQQNWTIHQDVKNLAGHIRFQAFHESLIPFLPWSWKSKMGPSNSSVLLFWVVFHFHDYGRKSIFSCDVHVHGPENLAKTHLVFITFTYSRSRPTTPSASPTCMRMSNLLPSGPGP